MGNGIWKLTATALLTFMLGTAAAFVTVGTNKVTREEVREMIHAQMIDPSDVRSLRDEIVLLKIQQATIATQLGELLRSGVYVPRGAK